MLINQFLLNIFRVIIESSLVLEFKAKEEKFSETLKITKSNMKLLVDNGTDVDILNKSVTVWIGRKCTMLRSFVTYHCLPNCKILLGIENKYSIPSQEIADPIVR